ncbi:sensor histidine kinase [Georgenia faecalis]|uniref:sensor histidine kinase n=1 Tax=Georgenia faecalis TaxID=2483799 RepID=UPI000FD7992C|nr:histidine kinase [Georgenia faecalis]
MAEPRRTWAGWLRPDSRVADAVVTVVAVLVIAVPSIHTSASYDALGASAGLLASITMTVALYWRRSRPVASAVVIYAAALAHFVLGAEIVVADLLIPVALYSVTAHGPRWAGRAALAGALLGAMLISAFVGGLDLAAAATLITVGAVVVVAWALGLLRRGRLERVETLVERARRLEIERDQQAQIATAAERARIAREMHDVVAHSLSVVIAQADGGRYAAAANPDAAVRALTTISQIGRDALADMRRILGVLRDPTGGEEAGTVAPQPVDADLDTLVEQVRGSGVRVSLVRLGDSRPLPPGAGLSVYRICQEALTNVLKHAGPTAAATVMLQWLPTRLVLEVNDDGRGAAASSDGAGHGLVGMRERVTLFGGTLLAGPRAGGGYRVRAEIPLPPAPTTMAGPPPPLQPAAWPAPEGHR